MQASSTRSFLLSQCQRRRRASCVTVTAVGVLIGVIILGFLVFGQNLPAKSTLKLVSVLFRHGDRTPTEAYVNDPHGGPHVWPDGWGALTKKGKQQMYALGQLLRARYAHFLSEFYSPADVLVRSSDNDRCLMSADTLLAGLYPPVGHQVWSPELLWQPIPVHATPRALDKLIVMRKPCPALAAALLRAYASPELQAINRENSAMYRYLSNHSGQAVDNITAVEFLFNTLEIEDMNNLDLPSWTKQYYPGKMRDLAARSLAIFTETALMKRLTGGPLVSQLVRHMQAKEDGTLWPDRRMFLYSVHDLTLVNVLRTLGYSGQLKPDYGATLFVELHETLAGIGHEVKLIYLNNTVSKEPSLLNVPHCGQPCFLETFVKLTQPVIPVDWEKECLNVNQDS